MTPASGGAGPGPGPSGPGLSVRDAATLAP